MSAHAQELEALPPSRAEDACELALKLFLERGFNNTPMSLIAAGLGLTKAGVYHHFPSKEHLLYVVHRNTMERLLLPIIERSERIAEPEARLRSFLVEYARLCTRDPSARLLISESKRLSAEHFEEIRRLWRRGFDLVRNALIAMQRQGRCRRELNPTYAAFAALGMCSWIFFWFDYGRPQDGSEVPATMADIFMNGVLEQRTQPHPPTEDAP
jgi:TetR/AcrR family transcriptional regulator, cholesterol catabolism regulator